jgi:hypothetical protein
MALRLGDVARIRNDLHLSVIGDVPAGDDFQRSPGPPRIERVDLDAHGLAAAKLLRDMLPGPLHMLRSHDLEDAPPDPVLRAVPKDGVHRLGCEQDRAIRRDRADDLARVFDERSKPVVTAAQLFFGFAARGNVVIHDHDAEKRARRAEERDGAHHDAASCAVKRLDLDFYAEYCFSRSEADVARPVGDFDFFSRVHEPGFVGRLEDRVVASATPDPDRLRVCVNDLSVDINDPDADREMLENRAEHDLIPRNFVLSSAGEARRQAPAKGFHDPSEIPCNHIAAVNATICSRAGSAPSPENETDTIWASLNLITTPEKDSTPPQRRAAT